MLGHDGFGMELHAFYAMCAMANSHDYSVGSGGRYFKHIGQGVAFDDQRMIARGLEAIRQALEYGARVMTNLRHLAVHQVRRANDPTAERLTYGLMSEAHAEYGHLSRKPFYKIERDACGVGRAGAGRDQHSFRHQAFYLFNRDFVIAIDLGLHLQFA